MEMELTAIVAATGALGAVVGSAVGALGKAWADNKKQDHEANMDQLKLALSQIQEQNVKIDLMGGQITNLNKRIENLLVQNTKLEAANDALTLANAGFRRDIKELQGQVRVLGHEPVMSDDVGTSYCCDPACPLAISKAAKNHA